MGRRAPADAETGDQENRKRKAGKPTTGCRRVTSRGRWLKIEHREPPARSLKPATHPSPLRPLDDQAAKSPENDTATPQPGRPMPDSLESEAKRSAARDRAPTLLPNQSGRLRTHVGRGNTVTPPRSSTPRRLRSRRCVPGPHNPATRAPARNRRPSASARDRALPGGSHPHISGARPFIGAVCGEALETTLRRSRHDPQPPFLVQTPSRLRL